MADTPLPPHIVVINDEQETLALFRDLLGDEGYRVSTLTYPVADLADLRIMAPDLVILDMIFGGEDRGWQFLQQLRLTRATAGLPVIVCTAAIRLIQEARDALEVMGIGVVAKPFDIDPFLAEVRRRLAEGAAPTGPSETPAGG
jgi:DNA-binding response OmpR family regulator